MKFDVDILHLSSGEKVTHYDDYERTVDADSDMDSHLYIWAEGNFSCDCNRALFWSRALGIPDIEAPCQHREFVVTAIRIHETGEQVYEEEVDEFPTSTDPGAATTGVE